MAGEKRPDDDATLRRLRYAAAIVVVLALGFVVGAYVIAYATREEAHAPDGPLVVILVTSLLVLLGLLAPNSSVVNAILGRRGDDERK